MWTCGSMKPGKTYLPLASMTSAPAGAARSRPIAVIVSPSQRMSATYWSVAVVIWPFLISRDMRTSREQKLNCGCAKHSVIPWQLTANHWENPERDGADDTKRKDSNRRKRRTQRV